MKKFLLIVFLVTLCAVGATAQNKKDKLVWETGQIVQNKYEASVRTMTVTETDLSRPVTDSQRDRKKDIYLRDDTETVKLRTADFTYTLTRKLTFIWHKKLKLKDGDEVKFALDGQDFMYLTDPKGKKIKYYIAAIVGN